MWFEESVFYQIYPLGFLGCERENDYGQVRHRLDLVERHISDMVGLNINAVLFNPLFESERHGYDTIDFFKVDRRIGDNESFKALVAKMHDVGIRVVLDGVFNHVGREFAPFKDVRERKWESNYCGWFNINFDSDTCYNDGFWYEGWEGHQELVKLNLNNPDVQNYLFDALRFWIREFDIDGVRLDVCYLLPQWFIESLRRVAREIKPDFYIVGEVIHGDYKRMLNAEALDSVTNYECYKGMTSALNESNLFEIEHSMNRLFADLPWAVYTGKHLLNFVDNHDVIRAFTALKDKRNIFNLYALLFAMPGIPCIYYGSEYLAQGDKSDNDYALRPNIGDIDKSDKSLYEFISKIAGFKRESAALNHGSYSKVVLSNTTLVFLRRVDGEEVYACINCSDAPYNFNVSGGAIDVISQERAETFVIEPFKPRILSKRSN